jgi:hypothetical protein
MTDGVGELCSAVFTGLPVLPANLGRILDERRVRARTRLALAFSSLLRAIATACSITVNGRVAGSLRQLSDG